MSDITVGKDGLYKDGIKLKLEFGNQEQIKAIRSYEKKVQELKSGKEIEPRYEVKGIIEMGCICGKFLTHKTDVDSEGDFDDFEGDKVKCYTCSREYKFWVERERRILAGKPYWHDKCLRVSLI